MLFLRRNYGFLLAFCLIGALTYAIIQRTSEHALQTSATADSILSVLILDPGHGGADGGAVSLSGTKESEINLDIALRLRALCRLFGIACLMTRDREELDYPESADSISEMKKWDTRSRVERINAVGSSFLLSIHQNVYPDPQPRGPQVFYNENCPQGTAELFQEYLNTVLCPKSRRLAAPISKDVYIMSHAECPAVLAECGFLSNPEEAAALDTDTYKLKIAAVLMAACLRSLGGAL